MNPVLSLPVIREIFPISIETFKKAVIIIFVIAVASLLMGCATPKQVSQLVRDVRVDTVYLSNMQYDSIYVYREMDKDYRRGCPDSSFASDKTVDTVYLKDVSIEYRYKLLRDTVCVMQRDSVPYQVTVVETREITRPLTWFDHLSRAITIAIALAFLAYLLKKSRNLALYVL